MDLLHGDFEGRVRLAAFDFLRRVLDANGGVVRHEDVAGFTFEGNRIALLDRQRGIRKPASMRGALSFRTVYASTPDERPYADETGPDGLERYKWRGTDPAHPENRALRVTMEEGLPCIWFNGIAQGFYVPVFPIWLVEEEPSDHQFVVALNEEQRREWQTTPVMTADRARYAMGVTRVRLHQPLFRARVLEAYERSCSLCHLRHPKLLDAAHIRRDSDGGVPAVTNEIAMCKLHHAAYDSNFIGIRPDYAIEVRADVLAESDGPTLRHAIQGLHGEQLTLPRRRSARPDPEALEQRYDEFENAS